MSLIPAPIVSVKEGGNGTTHFRIQSRLCRVAPRLQHNGTPSGADSFSADVHRVARVSKKKMSDACFGVTEKLPSNR
jgi:hypothetical protein